MEGDVVAERLLWMKDGDDSLRPEEGMWKFEPVLSRDCMEDSTEGKGSREWAVSGGGGVRLRPRGEAV